MDVSEHTGYRGIKFLVALTLRFILEKFISCLAELKLKILHNEINCIFVLCGLLYYLLNFFHNIILSYLFKISIYVLFS